MNLITVDICFATLTYVTDVWRSVTTEAYSVTHRALNHTPVRSGISWDVKELSFARTLFSISYHQVHSRNLCNIIQIYLHAKADKRTCYIKIYRALVLSGLYHTHNTNGTQNIMDNITQGNASVLHFRLTIYFKVSMLSKNFQGYAYPEHILGVIWKHGNLKAATNTETFEQPLVRHKNP